MKFYIRCEDCLKNITIQDGYNNDDDIKISIIGESIVEIMCKSCGESITTIDGNIF